METKYMIQYKKQKMLLSREELDDFIQDLIDLKIFKSNKKELPKEVLV